MTENSLSNPFPWQRCLGAVAEYLLANHSCREHDLIQNIRQAVTFEWAEDALMNLFQKHFAVRHSLYQLNRLWSEQKKMGIAIGPVDIQLLPCGSESLQALTEESAAHLETFYLDKSNFYSMRAEEIAELIANFWRGYDAHIAQSSAYKILGLPENTDWETVKRRYRCLVMSAHPDRGGDREEFALISGAYEQLKIIHGK